MDIGQEGDDGIHGDHEEDADNVALFLREGIVAGMLEDEVEGDDAGKKAGDGANEEADLVEGVAVKVGIFDDCGGG